MFDNPIISENSANSRVTRVNPNSSNNSQISGDRRSNQPGVTRPNPKTGGYYGAIQQGTIIDNRFYIGTPIHTDGAEAAIFRAHDRQTQNEVCIKAYIQGTHVRGDVRNKLLGLNHKNIAKLLTWGEWNGQVYEVWTLYRGETLQQILRRKHFSETAVIPFLVQMANALQAIHQVGIVHQDIKPANFMWVEDGTSDGKIVLIDFGVSSASDGDGRTHFSRVGNTTEYAAPEALTTNFCWKESDYYSLGVTLYEMQLGETPYSTFDKNEGMQKLDYMMSNRIPRIEELPPKMQDLIFGLMQCRPRDRWGYNAIQAWIRNDYERYKLTQTPDNREAQFTFLDRTYNIPSEIAALVTHMAQKWNQGEDCLDPDEGRFIRLANMLLTVPDDKGLYPICNEPRRGTDEHLHYFNKLYRLWPGLRPFAWRGIFLENYQSVGRAMLGVLWNHSAQTDLDFYNGLNPFDRANQGIIASDSLNNGRPLVYDDLEEITLLRVLSQYLSYQGEVELSKRIRQMESSIQGIGNAEQSSDREAYYYRIAYVLSGSHELRINGRSFCDKDAFVNYINGIVDQCRISGKNDLFVDICRQIKPSDFEPGFLAWAEVVAGINPKSFFRNQ